MTKVIEIVTEYLEAGGFDGLANVDAECGCFLHDLVPCGDILVDCRAGKRAVIDDEEVCVAVLDKPQRKG